MLRLVGETAGLALDRLETGDMLLPFCRLLTTEGESVIITPDDAEAGQETSDYLDRCAKSVWVELKRRITSGGVAEFAFCSDNNVKFQGDPIERRMLRIEFQNGSKETGIYYFPISIESGKASVGSYELADVSEKLL